MNSTIVARYNGQSIISGLEKPSDNTITYKGETILTLQDSDFPTGYQPELTIHTIKCGGKLMEDNLTVCGKVLKCKGKLMGTDIFINGYQGIEYNEFEELL